MTVRVVDADTGPWVAVMVEVPTATAVASPAVVMVAAGSDDAQVTEAVRDRLVPSL